MRANLIALASKFLWRIDFGTVWNGRTEKPSVGPIDENEPCSTFYYFQLYSPCFQKSSYPVAVFGFWGHIFLQIPKLTFHRKC